MTPAPSSTTAQCTQAPARCSPSPSRTSVSRSSRPFCRSRMDARTCRHTHIKEEYGGGRFVAAAVTQAQHCWEALKTRVTLRGLSHTTDVPADGPRCPALPCPALPAHLVLQLAGGAGQALGRRRRVALQRSSVGSIHAAGDLRNQLDAGGIRRVGRLVGAHRGQRGGPCAKRAERLGSVLL